MEENERDGKVIDAVEGKRKRRSSVLSSDDHHLYAVELVDANHALPIPWLASYALSRQRIQLRIQFCSTTMPKYVCQHHRLRLTTLQLVDYPRGPNTVSE